MVIKDGGATEQGLTEQTLQPIERKRTFSFAYATTEARVAIGPLSNARPTCENAWRI